MLLAIIATTYLVLAFAIVLTVDHIAGIMFGMPQEAARGVFGLRLFRRAAK